MEKEKGLVRQLLHKRGGGGGKRWGKRKKKGGERKRKDRKGKKSLSRQWLQLCLV